MNVSLLKDKITAAAIEINLREMINQIPDDWNPHLKLEFVKMAVRSTFANKLGESRKDNSKEIDDLEQELNQLETLRVKVAPESNIETESPDENVNKIDKAIFTIRNKLEVTRRMFSKEGLFRSRVKWFEYGEKSNKFFMNLCSFRGKQKVITNIKNGEEEGRGQLKVMEIIRKFYGNLYAKDEREEQVKDESYYNLCPKLKNDQRSKMDEEITLSEMKNGLDSCKESAPGQDGIPYAVYKHFWNLLGPFIKEAWDYSVSTGKMPSSHTESIITLLPKDGKDLNDIRNWRPITLSNCDSKIITKALANRMSKVLEDIVDPAQTAYIPGRSVMDNIRSNFFVKNYCRKNNINSILTSLDAKKAFDSVDHKYITEVLQNYGFGIQFIKYFKTIYSELTARIMVNGFMSEAIKMERGVKQGDALSCSIFILCIDPLIRNIRKSEELAFVLVLQVKSFNIRRVVMQMTFQS